eukprot:g18021.t1
MSSGSARPSQEEVAGGLQQGRRQRFLPILLQRDDDLEQEEDHGDDRRHGYPNYRNRRKPSSAEEALSRYPQMGKFEASHRTGIVVCPDPRAAAAEQRLDEKEESWMTTLAAVAASGTALALQAIPEGERRQHRRRRRRRRPPDVSSAATTAVQQLQAELSSRLDSLSSWRRGRVLSPRPARRRRRLTPLFSPGQASAAAALAARQHLLQLRARLSGMTTAAGRRTGALFSAARESGDRGLRITGGCGDLLRRLGSGLLVRSVQILKRGAAGAAGGRLQRGDEEAEEEGEWEGSRLVRLTDMTVQNVVDVVARDGWEHVATTSGVVVHRQYIALSADGTPIEEEDTATAAAAAARGSTAEHSAIFGGTSSSNGSGGGGSINAPRFACVKATAIISVPPEVVYLLFADNSRVSEYNEHCREVKDLEVLSQDSKITWAASGRMGPFKARDFCTLVHFRTLSDGTLAQVSRPVEHPAAPRSSRYVRSEILLAGNFMRPVPGDPSRTEFLMVTHVNPGGAAETRAGAMLVNSLCASSPVTFIRRLEVAAQKLMLELQQQQQQLQQPRASPPALPGDGGGGDDDSGDDVNSDGGAMVTDKGREGAREGQGRAIDERENLGDGIGSGSGRGGGVGGAEIEDGGGETAGWPNFVVETSFGGALAPRQRQQQQKQQEEQQEPEACSHQPQPPERSPS